MQEREDIAEHVAAVVVCGVGRQNIERQRMSFDGRVCVGVRSVAAVLVIAAARVHCAVDGCVGLSN